jgi:hypothetical protein
MTRSADNTSPPPCSGGNGAGICTDTNRPETEKLGGTRRGQRLCQTGKPELLRQRHQSNRDKSSPNRLRQGQRVLSDQWSE